MIDWRTRSKIIYRVLGYLLSTIEEYYYTPYEDKELSQKKERALSILGRDQILSKLDKIEEKKDIQNLIYELDLAVIYWTNEGYGLDAKIYQEIIDILKSNSM